MKKLIALFLVSLMLMTTAALAEAEAIEDLHQAARVYTDSVRPAMEAMRAPIDALEKIVDKSLWPFPSYGDMLFEV